MSMTRPARVHLGHLRGTTGDSRGRAATCQMRRLEARSKPTSCARSSTSSRRLSGSARPTEAMGNGPCRPLCARSRSRGPFAVCNADDLYGQGAFSLSSIRSNQSTRTRGRSGRIHPGQDPVGRRRGRARGLRAVGRICWSGSPRSRTSNARSAGSRAPRPMGLQSSSRGRGDVDESLGLHTPVIELLRRQFRQLPGVLGSRHPGRVLSCRRPERSDRDSKRRACASCGPRHLVRCDARG